MADQSIQVVSDGKLVTPVPMHTNVLANKDRLTVNFRAYFEHHGYDPVAAECIFADILETFDTEPIAAKRLKATKVRRFLPLSELQGQVGMIIIENRVGKNLSVNPTNEEKDAMATQLLFIEDSDNESGLTHIIRPGRCSFFEVLQPERLQYSSHRDDIPCPARLWVFPR